MRIIVLLSILLSSFGMPLTGIAAEEATNGHTLAADSTHEAESAATHDGQSEEGHHGLTAHPMKILHLPLGFELTNSMLVLVIVTAGIVIFAQLVSRNVKAVPSGIQNFAEWLVESMYNFIGEILGPQLTKKTFWFFATIFFFILFTNWFGLMPGVGTIGWNITLADGTHEFRPWLRGGNADLNMTSAMALLFFALWIVWALQANGPIGFLKHIFAPGVDGKGFMKFFMIAIFLFVGVLETLSILFRPVALSFRLFGNIFAGENVLESMMNLVPWLGWLIPLPFYFLELLVGLVQALVFMLLTAVFTLLICEHEHEEGHDSEEKHAH